MQSKSSSRAEARSAIARMLERGEEAVGVFVDELFSNRSFTDQLGKTFGRAADAKKRVDKNMQTVLAALNVPTRADYQRLLTKVEALQGSLVNVSMKLDRLLAAQHQPTAPPAHAPEPATPGSHRPLPKRRSRGRGKRQR